MDTNQKIKLKSNLSVLYLFVFLTSCSSYFAPKVRYLDGSYSAPLSEFWLDVKKIRRSGGRAIYQKRLPIGFVAIGLDDKPVFAQALFKGIKNTGVNDIESAVSFVQNNIKYSRDIEQFGRQDVWLSSEETLRLGKGDCEDQAILLADILLGLGYEARIMLGTLHVGKQSGEHAWVVVIENDKMKILDTTFDKRFSVQEEIKVFGALVTYSGSSYMFDNRYMYAPQWSLSGMRQQDLDWNTWRWVQISEYVDE